MGCFHRRGAGARRRRCKIFGPLRRRRQFKRGPIGSRHGAGARRASSPAPVCVKVRGHGDGGRLSRHPIRTATTAARASRGALSPWRRGMSGAATPSAWRRIARGGRWRWQHGRGAFAGAALGYGGASSKIFGLLRRRRRMKRGPIGSRLGAGARRASSPAPAGVNVRGDSDGGRPSRRPIRAATAAARAPRGALSPWRRGMSGAATPSTWRRIAPRGRRRRRHRRGASASAALGCGGAVPGLSVLCGGAARTSAAQSAAVLAPARDARLRLPPSASAGAVTATAGGLPVVRFALQRRRRGLREARFPRGVGGCWGPQRPRRGGASPLAGGGVGGNDGVLPPARRWGAAAPLQTFRSSAAAPHDQGRPSRRPSCLQRATRVFTCPCRSRRAR